MEPPLFRDDSIIRDSMQNKFDDQTQRLFDTLPKLIQETIMMSNVEIHNKSDLEKIAKNISKSSSQTTTE